MFTCISLQAVETIWWYVDRPLTDLPPMPSQIYRYASNPVKRVDWKGCPPRYAVEPQKAYTRRDVMENIRRQRCKKCKK